MLVYITKLFGLYTDCCHYYQGGVENICQYNKCLS